MHFSERWVVKQSDFQRVSVHLQVDKESQPKIIALVPLVTVWGKVCEVQKMAN